MVKAYTTAPGEVAPSPKAVEVPGVPGATVRVDKDGFLDIREPEDEQKPSGESLLSKKTWISDHFCWGEKSEFFVASFCIHCDQSQNVGCIQF